jgi:hypothetical protein
MKVKNYFLISALILMLVSSNLCFAQRNNDIDASQKVVAQSTFLSYKTVKDNFGKKFAQSYFVVQVDIRNETLDKQFIVQTVDVVLDPRQCAYAKEYYIDFEKEKCEAVFKSNFLFMGVPQPIRREEVIATGKADLSRSKRNIGFRVLAFSANVGSILTGFTGLIGRDGIRGINVLGTTATSAANALFPDTSDEKLENLRNALPTEDIIIKSKESRTFNIFLPTERIFWEKPWKNYIKPARDSDFEAYQLKAVLDLILISSATGVLIDNDAPTVAVRSDDAIPRQTEKLREANLTDETILVIDRFSATVLLLQKNLNNPATSADATNKLRKIFAEFKKEPGIDSVLSSKTKVTEQSEGKDLLQAIRILMRNLGNEELENKVMEIVIQRGN